MNKGLTTTGASHARCKSLVLKYLSRVAPNRIGRFQRVSKTRVRTITPQGYIQGVLRELNPSIHASQARLPYQEVTSTQQLGRDLNPHCTHSKRVASCQLGYLTIRVNFCVKPSITIKTEATGRVELPYPVYKTGTSPLMLCGQKWSEGESNAFCHCARVIVTIGYLSRPKIKQSEWRMSKSRPQRPKRRALPLSYTLLAATFLVPYKRVAEHKPLNC